MKHDNPDRARVYQKKQRGQVVLEREHWSHAPYNFIPLPAALIPARPPLDHDKYHLADGYTGYLDLSIETCSPTYIRGMVHETTFKKASPDKDELDKEGLSDEEKEERAPFFSSSDEEREGKLSPVIPGSSLRGLVRNLVEIVAHGRMKWVAAQPTFTYRAVAVQGEDPLKRPYQDVMGDQNNRKVRAGYLVQRGDNWFIHPAQTTAMIGWRKQDEPYIKIDDDDISAKALPGYLHLNHKNYRPQLHVVRFDEGPRVRKRKPGRNSSPDRPSIKVGDASASFPYAGILVCSGNMAETDGRGRSPRRKQAIVLPKDPSAPEIPIAKEAVEAYIKGLSTFLADKENMKDWIGGMANRGCLGDGKPVFYIPDSQEIRYFGHNPNFRIPALLKGTKRASTPRDFVPESVRKHELPDLAEAIFGWVAERDEEGPKEEARAGRVFFEDARFSAAKHGIWYNNGQAITPKILSTPRPTTFQHYLVQNAAADHDPDDKQKLAHFGTNPAETGIRGYKHYWHRGSDPDIKFFERDPQKAEKRKTQLTRMMPLKSGVQFKGRIHFENLRAEELGALLWVLNLPHNENVVYRHKLGMGKPLGLGAVAISAELHLSHREGRYAQLFDADSWYVPLAEPDEDFRATFENYILDHLDNTPASLSQVDRIQQFLTMLAWRGDLPEGTRDAVWQDWTEYMQIEHPQRLNEYVERPVLPTPKGVLVHLKYGGVDSQPASLSMAEQERVVEERLVGTVPRERKLVEGQKLMATVVDVFDGTVLLDVEYVAGLPAPEEEIEVMFRILPEYLSGKNYQPGAKASVVVVSIARDAENFEWVVDCQPANV